MYIDIIPNRSSPPAVLLRESYRENGKVKERTLANLSKLPAQIVERIRLALTNSFATVADSVCGAVFGVLFVLNVLAQHCGLSQALGHSRLAKLTLFLVLARIAHQGSRLSAVRWARDHAVKAVLGLEAFDEEDLYAALQWAAEQQDAIERHLFQDYVKHTGQTPTLVLPIRSSRTANREFPMNLKNSFLHNKLLLFLAIRSKNRCPEDDSRLKHRSAANSSTSS